MKNGWYAFGLLLAACAGAVAKPAVIPPATARVTPAAMPEYAGQKWEYRLITVGTSQNADVRYESQLRAAGLQGWELIIEGPAGARLKRPIPSQ